MPSPRRVSPTALFFCPRTESLTLDRSVSGYLLGCVWLNKIHLQLSHHGARWGYLRVRCAFGAHAHHGHLSGHGGTLSSHGGSAMRRRRRAAVGVGGTSAHRKRGAGGGTGTVSRRTGLAIHLRLWRIRRRLGHGRGKPPTVLVAADSVVVVVAQVHGARLHELRGGGTT